MTAIRTEPPRWSAYALSSAFALATIGLLVSVHPALSDRSALLFLVLPVALSAYKGGLGPGVVTTAIGFLAGHWLFIAPRFSLRIADTASAIHLIAFVAIGVLISLLCEGLRQARARSEADASALRDMEQQTRLITDSLPVLISYTDSDLRYRFNNAMYEAWFGLKREEITGRHLRDVLGDEAFARVEPYARRALAGEAVEFEETGSSRRDGARRVEIHYVPDRASDGAVRGFFAIVADVTERTRAQAAEREIEQRFRSFMEHLPGAAWMKDVAGPYVYVNSTASEVFGLPAERIVGRSDEEIFPALTAKLFRANDRLALEGGEALQAIETLAGPEGLRHSVVSKFPLFGADGTPEFIAGIAIDITERVRFQEALREEQLRLNHALTSARMVAWSIDPRDGRLVQSDTAVEVLGVRHEQASAMLDLVHPEDRAGHLAAFSEIVRKGGSWISRFRWRRPDGGMIWLEDHGEVVLGEDRSPIRYSGVTIDITERKRIEDELVLRERQFATLVENSPDAIFRLDRDLRYLFVNPAIEKLTGIPRERFVGRTARELGTEACACDVLEAECRAVLGTGETRSFEFADRGRTFRSRLVPETAADGTIASLMGVTEEITEQKHAEEERRALLESERAARGEAERANRLKDDFVATLSHELRTPLNAILGWTYLLQQEQTPAVIAQGLDVIDRNARIQTQMVSDLLDVSRIASGKIRLDVNEVDLRLVVGNAIESIRLVAVAKEIRLAQIDDGRPCVVRGDAARLQQVVWNLLSNAIKFTPEGGAVTLRLRSSDGWAEIAVEDAGQGIEPDFLPYLFERFRQADGTTTRKAGGLGLGLSISKQLVDMHGGEIRATSAGRGRGATFTVSLPTIASRASDSRTTPAAPGQSARSRPDHTLLSGLHVLVVDDQDDARDLLGRMLAEYGAEVTSARSAAEAVAQLAEREPHVLLSDLGMPDEDGFDLIRSIRAKQAGAARLPAAAVSALARPEDRRRAFEAGFDQHIAKPIEPAELIEVVLRLAGHARG